MARVEQIDEKQVNTYCAYGALIIFVVGELLFRYSTLNSSHPLFASFKFIDLFDCASMCLAAIAIITRPQKMSAGQAVLAGIGIAVLLVSAILVEDYRILCSYALLIAISNQDLKRICGLYGYTILLVVAIVVVLSTIGALLNKDVIPNSRLVFTYGFGHPNTTGSLLMAGALPLAYYFWNRRLWWVPSIIALICSVFSYLLLSSHACFAILLAMAILFVIGHEPHIRQFGPLPTRVFFPVLLITPMMLMTIMLLLTVCYDANNPLFVLINKLIHGRPAFAHNYYVDNGGFTVFGARFASKSSYHSGLPFASVDCGYSRLALVTGLLPMCVLLVTYIAAIRKLSKESPHFLIFFAFMLASLHMVVEGVQVYIVTGFAILFVSAAFARNESDFSGPHDNTLSQTRASRSHKEIS